ncbi:MAG: Uracil-DNA glycosylase, partial [Massilia sp.]|nr:Uracil-DNA glycosylase [Massilia sp.]
MSGTPSRINAAVAATAGQPVLVQSFAQWREAARELLAFDVAPHAVNWISRADGGDLFSSVPAGASQPVAARLDPRRAHPTLHLPRKLMDMLQSAACYRVDDRWAFLYRIVWRWQQGEQVVLSVADEDGSRLHAMVKAVHREEHDMYANIRFRERPEAAGAPRFVAWFEPAHEVLPQVAQHFVSRMGRVSWMIATPDASVLWDGETLHNTGPLMRSAAELDGAGEAQWLAYYRSIFNPARLNAAGA